MLINQGMDKQDMAYACMSVYTHTHTEEYYSVIKRNRTVLITEM